MTLVIKTSNEYKVLFEELAKALGATIRVDEVDSLDNEAVLLDKIERSYKQAKADERGEVKLRTLDDFLKILGTLTILVVR